ncbi:hypothetical protein [Alkalibacterium iburiense]|uniref:hypothetical protein n=1 Tax=Alkalibacterium iburiense TaxID=290589 RepID=UPI0031CDB3EC
MTDIMANPFFTPILTLVLSMTFWFVFSDGSTHEKKALLSTFSDVVFYFVLLLFGTNLILNFNDVLATPYRILLFSSNVVWIATFFIILWGVKKYGDKLWNHPDKARNIGLLFAFIGLINHLSLYYTYSNVQAVLFILLYIVIIIGLSSTPFLKRMNPLFVLFIIGFIHLIITYGQSVIYLNFVFYPIPLFALFILLTSLLYYKRRNLSSEQK